MNVSELVIGMLTYHVGTHYVYALLIDQQGLTRRFRLLRCEDAFLRIDRLVAAMEQPIAHTPSELAAVFREFAHGWGRKLLPPLKDLEHLDVLVIIPHHFIHGLPLHLVAGDDGQHLAAHHGITYCSSGTLFVRCVERNRARVRPAGPRTCLSVGMDVLTGKDSAYRALASAFAGHFQSVDPITTREELKDRLDPSIALPPDRARPDVICIVCHGYADATNADRSGLLLAGRRGVATLRNLCVHRDTVVRIQDHPFAEIPLGLDPLRPQPTPAGVFEPEALTVAELKVNCASDAELVALLGCSTGSGQVASSDEFASLAYQWLKAGSASVLANLWEADLPYVTSWVERFVASWVAGRPKAIAARDATREYLGQDRDAAEHLHTWGSMALFGDWL